MIVRCRAFRTPPLGVSYLLESSPKKRESMFRKAISLIVMVSLSSFVSLSQTQASDSTASAAKPAVNAETPAPKAAMQGFGLEDGTPVKLRTARTISSADAHTGDTLDFEVLEDVMVNGTLV